MSKSDKHLQQRSQRHLFWYSSEGVALNLSQIKAIHWGAAHGLDRNVVLINFGGPVMEELKDSEGEDFLEFLEYHGIVDHESITYDHFMYDDETPGERACYNPLLAEQRRRLAPALPAVVGAAVKSPEETGEWRCPTCDNTRIFVGFDDYGNPGDACEEHGDEPCECEVTLRQEIVVSQGYISYHEHTGGGSGASIGEYTAITCAACGELLWGRPLMSHEWGYGFHTQPIRRGLPDVNLSTERNRGEK